MSFNKVFTDAFYPAVRICFNVEKLVKAPTLLRVMTITRVTTKFIVGVSSLETRVDRLLQPPPSSSARKCTVTTYLTLICCKKGRFSRKKVINLNEIRFCFSFIRFFFEIEMLLKSFVIYGNFFSSNC